MIGRIALLDNRSMRIIFSVCLLVWYAGFCDKIRIWSGVIMVNMTVGLPDGIDDVLPEQAQLVESARKVAICKLGLRPSYTPMVEFTESLLSGSGSDLVNDIQVTDQISGRMMGIRADITPQTARMDAQVSLAGTQQTVLRRHRVANASQGL